MKRFLVEVEVPDDTPMPQLAEDLRDLFHVITDGKVDGTCRLIEEPVAVFLRNCRTHEAGIFGPFPGFVEADKQIDAANDMHGEHSCVDIYFLWLQPFDMETVAKILE